MKKYLISRSLVGLLMLGLLIPLTSLAATEVDPNPSASDCVALQNNLHYRSKDINTNGEVSDFQDFLQSKGYLNSEPTGYFGLLTVSAAKSFQSSIGITGDGYIGPMTRAKISSMTCGGSVTLPTTNLKTGCTSTSGFSSLTGESCGTNSSAPVISGVSGPQSLHINETGTWTVKASSPNGGNLSYGVNWGDEPTLTTPYVFSAPWEQTSASFLHFYTQRGLYNPVFTVSNNSGSTKSSLSVNVDLPACSTSGYDSTTGFRCGCSSTSGYSGTTGESCSNDLPVLLPVISYLQVAGCTSQVGTSPSADYCLATSAGATVYVFGKNFTQNYKVFFGDGRSSVTPTFINSTSLSFKVPTGLGGNPSIFVGTYEKATAIISNSVDMPLQPQVCSTSGYDSTTGLRCGCVSTSGWSSTTGLSCTGDSSVAPTVSISANPLVSTPGKEVNLTWSSTNAGNCKVLDTSLPGNGVRASGGVSGSLVLYPTATTTYEINCSQNYDFTGFQSYKKVTVTVTPTTITPYPAGCTSASGFSSIDGSPCGKTSTPPSTYVPPLTLPPPSSTNVPGCSSTSGWSATTGAPCSTGESVIIISSPENGVEYNRGDTVPVKWTSMALAGNEMVRMYLVNASLSFSDTNSVPASSPITVNQFSVSNGSYSWVIPSGATPGIYRIILDVTKNGSTVRGHSNTFTITSAPASFPNGCTSTSGWSSTTGLACNGSVLGAYINFPAGCYAGANFSITTGMACYKQ